MINNFRTTLAYSLPLELFYPLI